MYGRDGCFLPGSEWLKGKHIAKHLLHLAHSLSNFTLQVPVCLLWKPLEWNLGILHPNMVSQVRTFTLFSKVFSLYCFHSYLNFVSYFMFQIVFHITIKVTLTDKMSHLHVFPKQPVSL